MSPRSAPMSWQYVLFPHNNRYRARVSFQAKAEKLGYPYFCWNGQVFKTATGEYIGLAAEILSNNS